MKRNNELSRAFKVGNPSVMSLGYNTMKNISFDLMEQMQNYKDRTGKRAV